MLRAIAVAVLVAGASGCFGHLSDGTLSTSRPDETTPYAPMGYEGGYQSSPMGLGRHFVEVRVNRFTSRGTALRYLHQRAHELCAVDGFASYALEDSTTDESVSYVHRGRRVDRISKPQVAAMVRCIN